ncbi:cytochrome P450 [Aspergillus undulatus]|uniref:cytochrome P450 n=1 Tax=Aspergillus undulatus TaxID=1810928 RepID=UPI003CCDAA54
METKTIATNPILFTRVAALATEHGIYGTLAAGLAGLILYNALLTIYRLYFHPLARFPGPKIAAATRWYEFYYDVIKAGSYVYKIDEMHKVYGPIVRINPHELVINDPKFYNEVYVAANTRRTEIWPRYRTGLGFDGSHVMTQNHDLHRRRRKPLEPFFSRLGIDRIEHFIIEETKLLDDRLQSLAGSGIIVRLDHLFSAFAGDVIGRICAESEPDLIKRGDFGEEWHNLIEGFGRQLLLFMHIPQLISLARIIPTGFLSRLYPGGAVMNVFREMATTAILTAKADKASANTNASPSKTQRVQTQIQAQATKASKTSIFRHILFSSGMPESECDTERLSREAMVLFSAGTATTARTTGFICFYILNNPGIRERLTVELSDSGIIDGYDHPEKERLPTWQELERLPYLHAVVREGLRLSYGVMRRLPRVSPDIALQYKNWTIPRGTPVGMAAYSLHTDPEVYEHPFAFIPERWLGDVKPELSRNWVPFSRGSRNCLGMKYVNVNPILSYQVPCTSSPLTYVNVQSMAYAEIYWALAVLFRPGAPRIESFETDESDVAQAVDYMMPLPKLDSRGNRVVVR